MDDELAKALSQLARALVYIGDIYKEDVRYRVGHNPYATRPAFANRYDWQAQRDEEEAVTRAYLDALEKERAKGNEE